MGDASYQFPVALKWDEGPDSLKQLRNKLLVHFQSKNKSNGGECQIRDLDCSRGYILIYFREEAVRDQVLQKHNQELKISKGKTLNLSVTLPEDTQEKLQTHRIVETRGTRGTTSGSVTGEDARQPEETWSTILIENIPDSCSSEMLSILVENISEKNIDKDFYVEMIPHSAAVITFTCDIDIHHFMQNFSSSLRVTQLRLKVKLLEGTTSIRVENLPKNTSEQHLTFYFESPRLGGGKVQETVMLEEEGAALLQFCDTEAVKKILKKEQHVFNRIAINVYPYYPSLNIHLYGKNQPHVAIPDPIKFDISPYILEYILNNNQIKHSIDSKMEDKDCMIKWPSPDCQNPVIIIEISQTLSSNLRTMAKVARTWTEKVSNEFSMIISRYKVIDCKINPLAWEDIKEQTSTSAYEGVLIKPNPEAEKVFLAGTMKDVNKMEKTFRELVEKISKKTERKSQLSTMTEPMSAALYHIIRNSGVEKKILADVPELKMEYDPSTQNIHLTGLRDEVLQAKCEILSVKQQLESKSIPLDPHILQFLKFTDHKEVLCFLFIRHNINALIEMEDNGIKLTGYSKKDWMNAKEQIDRELSCQVIPVEDKDLLQSPEWKNLKSHLHDSFNSETCTVLIQEFPHKVKNNVVDVVVAGLSSNVQLGYQQLKDFVDNNAEKEVKVPVPSRLMLRFIEEVNQQTWQKINTKVKLMKNENSLSIFAPRLQAEEAAAQVLVLLSSLYCDSLRIDKPGARKFCKNYEEIHATTARTKFNCVILLERDGEYKPIHKAEYEVKIQSGVTIAVYQDDLCRHNVDVIVNAANEDLKHCGGLALALLKAAGPILQDDCNHIIKKMGKVPTGESVITNAGNLPCKQVIHTVGPRWDPQTQVRCEKHLRRAITTSLDLAAENGHSSIAIPAVSSGIYGFPLKQCAENILDGIENYMEKQGSSTSLKRIHIVDMNVQTTQFFSELLRNRFGDKKSSGAPVASGHQGHISSGRSEKPQVTVSREDVTVATPMGLIIKLVQKKIEDATTNVIVNSVGTDLVLTQGQVSKAIYKRAGVDLQQLVIDENMGAQVSPGTVIPTDGCNLNCNKVLHVVTPQWDKGRGTSETVLRKIIQQCLTWTEQQGMTSLSIPALGTGNLGFPKVQVAALMFDAICQFSTRNKPQNLQEVEIVLHPSDTDTIQAFNNELVNYTDDRLTSTKQNYRPGSIFYSAVTNPSLGVHEMRIGSLTFQVKTGDITKEASDVIVNSSNNNFTLNSGVSKAILEAAGLNVQLAAAALGSQPHKGYIITNSGNLVGSSWILHVSGPSQATHIKKIVLDCLRECEKHQATSVAFPALGTGAGRLAPALVADAILDGVMDFINSGAAKSIQTVKVVIFQQHMLNDFYMSMKKKEGTALPGPKSLFSKFTDLLLPSVPSFLIPKAQKKPVQKLTAFQLLDNIEPVIFSLCSDDKENVQKTKQWLQQQIEYEQNETTLTDECISELEDIEYDKIRTLQRKFQVSIVYKPPDPSIRISGLTRDVLEVSGEIQKIVNSVKDRKSRERAAELTGNLVEWRYQHGSNMIPFDNMANLELEEAKNANKTQVTVQIRNRKITVDLKNLTATDNHGNQIEIGRAPKHEKTSLKLPDHWQPMNNSLVIEVDLPVGSSEYSQVQQQFAQTCGNRILKIQRIQNKDLWLNYQIKKQTIDTRNGTTNNEKQLFHGTDLNSVKHINHNGFNRGYAGRHAAMYGNGTYFAVNANYSARGYSRPDAQGQKHLYLARVLTGVFCGGQSGMVAPPAKNPSNSTDLYDSVTDNPGNPSMFIIFNDIQAYPEYHITFC
ncbi:protein mono-ADP-ribosyltransferase PARP14-like [Hyla sarda]|uniref:protein mono-ADP-ribosyltransferase PARP14-like n=1 Tax=Hyla sarda TaxID=327740 RepID=UPI0024C2EF96|nr:protein mono-ADP-ribosyltransferase PARP14-like [Hyla sarda]